MTELSITIQTNIGDIYLNLTPDLTPITVASFINLVARGYYDGLIFHRVIPDFMVQGGCPLGAGYGGPGYKFEDEFVTELKHDVPGILSMANSGPFSNGSQFFITHVPTPWLDGKHSVFGKVTSGQDIVNKITQGNVINKIIIHGDYESFLEKHSGRVAEWNAVLDKK